MVNVVRAVSAAASIQTPALVDRTDPQLPPPRPAIRLGVGDLLAGVLGNLPSPLEVGYGKAALPFDWRFPDGQAWREG